MTIDMVSTVQNISTMDLPEIEYNDLFHSGLAGGLKEWMEDQVFDLLSHMPTGLLPVVVDFESIGRCNSTWPRPAGNDCSSAGNNHTSSKGGYPLSGDLSDTGRGKSAVGSARDILVRKLFNLQVTTGKVNPRRSFETAIEAIRLSDHSSGLVKFIRTCKPTVIAALKREVEAHARQIVSHWGSIPGYMYPRANNRYTISCHGGDLIFTGVCDLILAAPGNVLVNICTDTHAEFKGIRGDDCKDAYDCNRVDQEEIRDERRDKLDDIGCTRDHMRYLALLSTLREGTPPCNVMRWYSADGRFEVDTITERVLKEALDALLRIAEQELASAGQSCLSKTSPSGRVSVPGRSSERNVSKCNGIVRPDRSTSIDAGALPDLALVRPEVVQPNRSTRTPDTMITVDTAELAAWRRALDSLANSSLVDADNCHSGGKTEISAYHIGLYLNGVLDKLRAPAVAFCPSPLAARKAIGIAAIERIVKDTRLHRYKNGNAGCSDTLMPVRRPGSDALLPFVADLNSSLSGVGYGVDLAGYVDEVLETSSRDVHACRYDDRVGTWHSSRWWWAEWYAQLSLVKKAMVKAEAINWISNAWQVLSWALLPSATEFGPRKASWYLSGTNRLRVTARWDIKVRHPSGRFLVLSTFDGSTPSRWEEMLCLPMFVPLMNGNPHKPGGLGGVPVRSIGIWLGSGQVRTCDISWEILEKTAVAALNALEYVQHGA